MRSCGILMNISSLPSPYGIGTMGRAAYDFVDFLKASGVSVWQMLPTGPTGYGDSPYQSFCAFAGNPYFIDLDMLCDEGLLDGGELLRTDFGDDASRVDYGKMYAERFRILETAYRNARGRDVDGFNAFREENAHWLPDYALFTALKKRFGGASWHEWDDEFRLRDADALDSARRALADDIECTEYTQYLFFKQWKKLKAYANDSGVRILGDIPIYVAPDSSDIWANPEVFLLDHDRRPVSVAGVPPDYFSEDGQLWGNPLYDWAALKDCGYKWWVDRARAMLSMFDMLRIDHFIGFARYYAIAADCETAREGEWREGPGRALFDTLRHELGELPIIAEDLGIVTDSVRELLKYCGFPGMKVIEFAFGSDGTNMHLPHNIDENTAYYIATHDNDTAAAWWESAGDEEKAFFEEYFGMAHGTSPSRAVEMMTRAIYASRAELAVMQMQDVLALGREARMNLPATCGGNWCWRARRDMFSLELSEKLFRLKTLYSR